MRCIECDFMEIELDAYTNASARCNKLKGVRGKGKIVSWACTTYKNEIDAFFRFSGNPGIITLLEILKKKKKAPYYCPFRIEKREGTGNAE